MCVFSYPEPPAEGWLSARGSPAIHRCPSRRQQRVSVVCLYDPQVPTFALQLSACILAGIYTGKVTRWNDPVIAEMNR